MVLRITYIHSIHSTFMVIHQITADDCVKMARKQSSDELSLEYYALYILFKTMQYISFYSSLKYFKNNKRKVIWTKTYCLLNSVCSCSIKSPLIKWGLNLIECEWVEQRLTLPSQEYISQNVMENKIICLSPLGNQLLFLCLIDMIRPTSLVVVNQTVFTTKINNPAINLETEIISDVSSTLISHFSTLLSHFKFLQIQ